MMPSAPASRASVAARSRWGCRSCAVAQQCHLVQVDRQLASQRLRSSKMRRVLSGLPFRWYRIIWRSTLGSRSAACGVVKRRAHRLHGLPRRHNASRDALDALEAVLPDRSGTTQRLRSVHRRRTDRATATNPARAADRARTGAAPHRASAVRRRDRAAPAHNSGKAVSCGSARASMRTRSSFR